MSDQTGSKSNLFSGDIDPEIADLMGIDGETRDENAPEFDDLFGEGGPRGDGSESTEKDSVDLTKERFSPIEKFEDEPHPWLRDKNFYKKALSGEGEPAKRVHKLLSQFLNAEDPKDKSVARSRLISAYWDLVQNVAARIYKDLPEPKIVMLRYGALLPTLISAEQREILSKIVFEDTTGEPIYYVDEWLEKVATGAISASATDEVKHAKKNSNQKINAQLEKARGNKELHSGMIKNKMSEMFSLESQFRDSVGFISQHGDVPGFKGLKMNYSEEQRKAFSDMQGTMRRLLNLDREISGLYSDLNSAVEQLEQLEEKAQELGVETRIDDKVLSEEFNTIRQMAKMCVGRQGNHLPILMKQYMRPNMREIATRENVIMQLAAIENLDPGAFRRTFKRQTNRIIPYVILLPSYGDSGICWEPFDKYNRATSRGRIAIPMYPKDLQSAVIGAVADLRWQVAKEKAQHYWMEEGLTGFYYQWFTDKKLRGDVREFFIQDYILWITKESEGTQKLDRDVRGIFWRHVPFPQELKDRLKTRGFVYGELAKKDLNRSLSDGY
jgi:hypothetical protein